MRIDIMVVIAVILLGMIVGYNILIQIKEKENQRIFAERKRSFDIINSTEDILAQSVNIPFSRDLIFVLNNRVIKELEYIIEIDKNNRELVRRKQQKQEQMNSFLNSDKTPNVSLRVPDNEQQAIALLKLIKRFKDILRTEHKKGHINTKIYTNETARLDSFKVKVNIENALKRIKNSIYKGDKGTAQQLAHKSLAMLDNSYNDDDYAQSKRAYLNTVIADLEKEKADKIQKHIKMQEAIEKSDLDALFGDKKKW